MAQFPYYLIAKYEKMIHKPFKTKFLQLLLSSGTQQTHTNL